MKRALEEIAGFCKRNMAPITVSLSGLAFASLYGTAEGASESNLLREMALLGVPVGTGILAYFVARETGLRRKVEELSVRDSLTGLYNAGYFQNYYMPQALVRAKRRNEELSLLFCDLDNFKNVNDLLGHQRGDEVLRDIAELIKASAKREIDTIVRYGGDEFIVVLEATGMEGAEIVAGSISSRVNEYMNNVYALMKQAAGNNAMIGNNLKPSISIGISIGIASARDLGYNLDEIIRTADTNMYAQKTNGRK